MHLPIARSALLTGVLLALARGMGEVGISLVLGGFCLGLLALVRWLQIQAQGRSNFGKKVVSAECR